MGVPHEINDVGRGDNLTLDLFLKAKIKEALIRWHQVLGVQFLEVGSAGKATFTDNVEGTTGNAVKPNLELRKPLQVSLHFADREGNLGQFPSLSLSQFDARANLRQEAKEIHLVAISSPQTAFIPPSQPPGVHREAAR